MKELMNAGELIMGFVDNEAVLEIDRWTDGTYLIEIGKRIIGNKYN